jgi:ABC-type Fe3+ transport system permease subunit
LAIGIAGFLAYGFFGAPVIVDTFDSKHPPGFLDVVIPNLIVALPSAVLLATAALLIGWLVAKRRSRNRGAPPTPSTVPNDELQ